MPGRLAQSAVPASQTPPPRAVLLIHAPATLRRAVHEIVQSGLEQDVTLLPYAQINATTKRRQPDASTPELQTVLNRAAQLHLSYIVDIQAHWQKTSRAAKILARARGVAADKPAVLNVVLLRLQPDKQVLLAQTYHVAQVSNLSLQSLHSKLRQLMRQNVPKAVVPWPGVDSGYPEGSATLPPDVSPDVVATANVVPDAAAHAWQLSYAAGLVIASRQASIDGMAVYNAGAAPTLNYNANGSSNPVCGGLQLRSELLWSPHPRLQLGRYAWRNSLQAYFGYTYQSLRVGTELRGLSHWPLSLALRTALALRPLPTAASWWLSFEAGYWGYFFRISDGAFPGLTYNSPSFGVDNRWAFGAWQMEASLNLLVALQLGDEAYRLGSVAPQLGWLGHAAVHYQANPQVTVTLTLDYQKLSAHFSGDTFLYSLQRYANATLQDSEVRGGILLGATL